MPALMRVALAATVVFAIPTLALAGEKTFPDSVDVLENGQARFPLYEGVRDGETVYFLIVESLEWRGSDRMYTCGTVRVEVNFSDP